MTKIEIQKASKAVLRDGIFYVKVSSDSVEICFLPESGSNVIGKCDQNSIYAIGEVFGEWGRVPGVGWLRLDQVNLYSLGSLASGSWLHLG